MFCSTSTRLRSSPVLVKNSASLRESCWRIRALITWKSKATRMPSVRWTVTEGPTKGTTNEHVFNEDGTVTWSVIEGPSKGRSSTEKKYAVWKITDDVLAVSYLAQSGYTLTVILNFSDNSMVGFASGAKEWYPIKGTFQLVSRASERNE